MQSGSFDGGVGGEYNGVGLVEMYEMFVAQMILSMDLFICLRDRVGFIPDNADELS